MLKRIYIDNYKCFEDFTFEPQRLQLLLGGNGAGKSALFEVLDALRAVAIEGRPIKDVFGWPTQTRWRLSENQRYGLGVSIDAIDYLYELEIWSPDDERQVAVERLSAAGQPVLEFKGGAVRLTDENGKELSPYRQEPRRCVLGTIPAQPGMRHLSRFKDWLHELYVLRVDPTRMNHRASRQERRPDSKLSNFAGWYRHLALSEPRLIGELQERLEAVLSSFHSLSFEDVGQNTTVLEAKFHGVVRDGFNRPPHGYSFAELSDGQRALIGLYTLLEFAVTPNRTLCIDEPDNFVNLREIQPWLNEVIDRTEDTRTQVIFISHHPELINLLAYERGAMFVRDGQSSPRVVPYKSTTDGALLPSEEIARGWELG